MWCGEAPLKVSFLEIYRITRDKDALVANHLRVHNDVVHWELDFICSIHDWELESVSNFLDLLYSVSTKGQGVDQMCWKPSATKVFEVRSFYCALSPLMDVSFPWKATWKPRVPPRVTFFIWTVALGKILTADNLRRRNIIFWSIGIVCVGRMRKLLTIYSFIAQWLMSCGLQFYLFLECIG